MLVLVVKVSLELWSRIKRGVIYSVAALWALSQHIWFENNHMTKLKVIQGFSIRYDGG